MCVIAERLVLARAASAERNFCSAAQIEFVAVDIEKLEIPFDTDAPVRFHCDFCGHCLFLFNVKIR